MSISTYQGVVENGQIKFSIDVRLPEKAKVYVVIADEKPKFDLKIMAARMPENYKLQEENFGEPVGKEAW
jgi:hypothetical protein